MPDTPHDSAELLTALRAGDRRALGRAITLVESERAEDAEAAERLLAGARSHTGASLRVGVSGPPGAGKSTLIDALGRHALEAGERVAVLAIDPSSPVAGGSLLGDKTRMAKLATDPRSFIRPSPSRGQAGGVSRRTREAIGLCEAAGYSLVMVETVGAGQGEHAVAALVDVVVLVLIAGAGDELQGMKRGLVELSDVLVVNKADGEQRAAAERAAGELTTALGFFARTARDRVPRVLTVSARDERGLAELWTAITDAAAEARASGAFEARRAAGERRSFDEEVEQALRTRLAAEDLAAERARLEAEVLAQRLTPREAARKLVQRLG
jgi:LAO/AO transport system kinase